MAITAQMVKELREATGCGMMDSKKALTETNGDFDKAIEYLRKKGLAGAEKKAGRIAAEGITLSSMSSDMKKCVLVEVNSETDFVAKNEKFRTYVKEVCDQALNSAANDSDMDSFMQEKWHKDNSKTVKEELSSQISVIGENLIIRRKATLENKNGLLYDYIHGGGRIAVIVSIDTDKTNDNIKEMAKNIAMQIASMNPKFLDESEISDDYKNKEKQILLEKSKNENPGKPDNVINGMVEGRFKKELKELCLMDQEFVFAKEGKQSVADYVKEVANKESANIKIAKFIRFETGEGLEKKNEDFAAEVAAQMGK